MISFPNAVPIASSNNVTACRAKASRDSLPAVYVTLASYEPRYLSTVVVSQNECL